MLVRLALSATRRVCGMVETKAYYVVTGKNEAQMT